MKNIEVFGCIPWELTSCLSLPWPSLPFLPFAYDFFQKIISCTKYGVAGGVVLRKGKEGKVVYGQEPPSGESTTTECGFNYQLLAVITEVVQWGSS